MRWVLGVAAAGLAIFAAATATADPAPDPALIVAPPAADSPAPDAPAPGGVAPAPPPTPAPSASDQTKSNPVGTLTDLLRGAVAAQSANPLVQQSVPATNPLTSVGLLMPQNFGMPTGDQPSPYALGENAPSGFARIDAYQGVHALLHGSLGRIPGTELGQPLPGTAPPPGTALPPGLVQYFDPAAAAVPSAGPADPAAPVVAPPGDPLLLPAPTPN
jgi:hypothetical protein